MPNSLLVSPASLAALFLAVTLADVASAQTVWSGLTHSFSKPDSADWLLPENQDRLTDNIWLTRADTGGLFNIRQEAGWDTPSPADTEWATDINNPSETIAAANWASLTFANWIDAYGGLGSGSLPARLISRDAVVHLVSDDIYLDLRFTGWTQQGGGGFSYLRAEVPEPTTCCLLLCGIIVLNWRSRRPTVTQHQDLY